jgi:hypothetical protein
MLFGLFGKKELTVKTDSAGQPYRLAGKMREVNLSHDQTVLADVNNVAVIDEHGKPVMYFCNIRNVQIHKELSPGDGDRLPETVELNGIKIPKGFKTGSYNLRNVKLYSNGAIQIIATAGTKVERV